MMMVVGTMMSGVSEQLFRENLFVGKLVRKIEDAHVVWFEECNQWVQFDEPKWFIFLLYQAQVPQDDAVRMFSGEFNQPYELARAMVANIYDSLYTLTHPHFTSPNFAFPERHAHKLTSVKVKTHHYQYLGKDFSIGYGSAYLEDYIHLPFAHMEEPSGRNGGLELEVLPLENSVVLRLKSKGGQCLMAREAAQIKRLLFIELACWFYDKKQEDWMSFAHAAALQKGDEVLLVSSPSGSGKSTLAGLLQLHGFHFYADDFVPLDGSRLMAYPFPAALCIKKGAIALMQSLGLKTSATSSQHNIAYMKPYLENQDNGPKEVKKMVFLYYKPGADFSMSAVSTLEALALFHQEAWVGDNYQRAEKFIDWFTGLQFYKIIYDNNAKVVQAFTKLMENSTYSEE